MTDKITVEISKDLLFEACALVYSKWCKEYDMLKLCKAETNDGSDEWQAFHDERLKRQTELETKWSKRVDEAALLSKLTIAGS